VYEIDINVLKDVMTNKMASKLKDKITKKMDKYFSQKDNRSHS
jgi:hypothetical protein